ncbi:GbpC/Spa domain-containing protein [uncultured Streptococcus sp.]|uniref:GbpC/Spa domain-containing protein n=1 Tax=uncultured Streptococcus sp. TaxID=83427 RepID=UPI0025E9512F|nr:GbpC/Spa domain-containing protein [uncultured Streptococcus sp.]
MEIIMEKKIVYGFRKSRLSKGLCGAVLGAALLLAAGSVQAEEKSAEAADQSSLSEAALSPTEAHQPTVAPTQSEPVSQDKLPLEVSHADLDQTLAEAEKAGIELKQEPTVDLGTARNPEEAASKRETALADYVTQVKEIRETTAAYQEQLKTYEKDLSQKESANQALKDQYDKTLASYAQESNRIQAENAQLQADYEQKRAAYQAELSRIVKINQEKEASYQAALAAYQEESSRILQENAQAKADYKTAMESYATELKATQEKNAEAKRRYEEKLAQVSAHNKAAQAENAAIAERNQAAEKTYQEAVKQYEAEVSRLIQVKAEKEAVYQAALADYEKELARIQKENAELEQQYQSDLRAYQQEVERIQTANQEAKQSYETALAKIQEQNKEIETQNLAVRKKNAALKEQYQADLAAYQERLAEIRQKNQAAEKDYESKLAAYQKNRSEIEASNEARERDYQAALTAYQSELERVQAENKKRQTAYETEKAEVTARNAAIEAENAQIRQQNQEKQELYKNQLAQYEQDVARITESNQKSREAYEKALLTYQEATARIETENKNKLTAYQADLATYKADLARIEAENQRLKEDYEANLAAVSAQNAVIEQENASIKEKNARLKADYDKLLEEYKKAKAAYDTAKTKYDAALVTFERELQEAEAKKNEEGYLSKVESQPFVFKSEPQAVLTLDPSIRTYTNDELTDEVRSWRMDESGMRALTSVLKGKEHQTKVVLQKDVPLVATYTNIKNSSIQGKKIAKVVYTYTLKESTKSQDKLPVFLVKDPTLTVWTLDFHGQSRVNVQAEFFDEAGERLDMTGSLVSFSSLNTNKAAIEYIKNFNGEYVPITGSAINIHPDTSVHADISINFEREGSRFEYNKWDTPTSPYNWYGAIVGKAQGDVISFDIGSRNRGSAWFVFNSDIKAKGVPMKPVAPTEIAQPQEPTYEELKALQPLPIQPVYQSLPEEPAQPAYQELPSQPTETQPLALPSRPEELVALPERDLEVLPQEPTYKAEPLQPQAPAYQELPDEPSAPSLLKELDAIEEPTYEKEQSLLSLPQAPVEEALPQEPQLPSYLKEPEKPQKDPEVSTGEAPKPPVYEEEIALEELSQEPSYLQEPQLPQEPVLQPEPQSPIRESDLPLIAEPDKPNYKELPQKPAEPSYQALPSRPQAPTQTYHYNQLFIQLKVREELEDESKKNIHQQEVSQGSFAVLNLVTDALPAYRLPIHSFVLEDRLPEGFELDLEATRAKSPGYEVSYEPSTRVLTFVAAPGLLERYNADLNIATETIAPAAVGRLLYPGRTYTNHFSLLINNQYRIESNQVSVSTPPAEITVQTAQKFEPLSNRTWQHPRSASKQASSLQLSVSYQTTQGQLPKTGSSSSALLTYLGFAALLAAAGFRSSKKES